MGGFFTKLIEIEPENRLSEENLLYFLNKINYEAEKIEVINISS